MLNKTCTMIMSGIIAAVVAGCGAVETSSLNEDQTSPLEMKLTGMNGETTIKEQFKGKYMMIDLSGANCPYCRQLAKKHQADSEFLSIIKSEKCSSITVVGNYQRWNNLPGFTEGTKARSFSTPGGIRSIASKFKAPFGGSIPFVFIIDEEGTIVLKASNRDVSLANFKKACSAIEDPVEEDIEEEEGEENNG